MANNFKIIYKILKILENAMEYAEFDNDCISYGVLGISEALWCNIMKMLVDNEYVEGVHVINFMGGRLPGIKLVNPSITLKGLEYLEENSLMKKASRIAKGLTDIIK
jgi:YjcQ protein.